MDVTQISAGRDRSVLLTQSGAAWSWGAVQVLTPQLPPGYIDDICTTGGRADQIGHRRFAHALPVALNPGQRWASVVDGCVSTVAVADSGAVLECRPVVSRERGSTAVAPVTLPAGPTQVALTESAGFALYADGTVWSWGMRVQGQLGRGAAQFFDGPGKLAALPPIRKLAAGHAHVLALDARGGVWAWGANGAGQLGAGDLTSRAAPTKIDLPGAMRSIAAGDTHSFAIDHKGRAWAWGSHHLGQLGDVQGRQADASFHVRPRAVRTDFALAQLDAGMHFTVALSTHGDVFAWGWNGMGQLANESHPSTAAPQRVSALRDVSRISVGQGHVLALSDAGVFAWGDNRTAACGTAPSTAVQASPNLISWA